MEIPRMKALSMDLRQRVVAASDRGEGTPREIAARFAVSLAWVYRLLQRRRQTGSIAPKPHGGGQRPAFDADADGRLRRAVADRPDATLPELPHSPRAPSRPPPAHRPP